MTWYNNLHLLKDGPKDADDGSATYIKNKNLYFYVGHEISQRIIVFKPFLTDFSIDLSVSTKSLTEAVSNAAPEMANESSEIKISVGLDIPSVSIEDSKENLKKVSAFMQMLSAEGDVFNIDQILTSEDFINLTFEFPESEQAIQRIRNQIDARLQGVDPGFEKFKQEQRRENPHLTEGNVASIYYGNKESRDEVMSAIGTKDDERLQKLYRDLSQLTSPAYLPMENVFNISFVNLIQSGLYDKQIDILSLLSKEQTDYDNLIEYGIRCNIMNVNAKFDTTQGFFEDRITNDLYPKVINLSFTMEVINKLRPLGYMKNIVGFGQQRSGYFKTNIYGSDGYHDSDIKYWPFGVQESPATGSIDITLTGPKKITTVRDTYLSNKKNTKLLFYKYEHLVDFYPFIDSLSVSRKIDQKQAFTVKTLTQVNRVIFDANLPVYDITFNIVSNSVAEARKNHIKIQKLMRMIYPEKTKTTTSKNYLFVSLQNLIHGRSLFNIDKINTSDFLLRCNCTKINIKPDPAMGYFDLDGMLYMKACKINLTLQVVDKSMPMRLQ